ncbi:MAG: hypothetical protein ACLPKB_06955 [Xanthobacteraceae bacterium]
MQQIAVLSSEHEDQSIDKPQQLSKKLWKRQRARPKPLNERGILRMDQKPIAEALDCCLDPTAQLLQCPFAFALTGIAPSFERTVGRHCAGNAEAAGMNQQPQGRKIRKCFTFEDAPQVRFDIGGAGQAGVVAHEAQQHSIRAYAPLAVFTRVKPVLQGGRGRAPAAFGRQVCARAIQVIGRRHDYHRHSTVKPFEGDGELSTSEGARPNAAQIAKTEYMVQQLFDESNRRGGGRCGACHQLGQQGLADAEIARDLIA